MPAPFAFVEEAPIVGSPACKAGLLAGDAILRFGAATCLENLAGEIVDGKAVRVSVVEAASGKTVSRIVVPCVYDCLLYTSPSPRDGLLSRMPSSA